LIYAEKFSQQEGPPSPPASTARSTPTGYSRRRSGHAGPTPPGGLTSRSCSSARPALADAA